MGKAASAGAVDVRDMLAVHAAFRREFGLAPRVVRETGDDGKKGKAVSGHIGLLVRILTIHHEGEDECLWPPLAERGGNEVAAIIRLMEEQHAELHDACAVTLSALDAWATGATTGRSEQLAECLERLARIAHEHMRAEEQNALPLAAKYLTVAEWRKLGEHSLSSLPKKDLPLAFGMSQYEADPDVMKGVLADAPLPVRLIMPVLGRRLYRSHARKVYGTPTPPVGVLAST